MSLPYADAGQQIQSKVNLPKAFQFIEGRPLAAQSFHEDDKENKQENRPNKVQNGSQSGVLPVVADTFAKAFPSTPATRLPLTDLIGNTDDLNYLVSRAGTTPDEKIHWHALRSPNASSSKRTPARKRTKRARSSSPTSPPFQATPRDTAAEPESIGSDNARLNPRTPQVDPATNLWNRYAINVSKDGSSVVRNISLTNLMVASSPYSADNHASNVSGLRRWTSCGKEWPNSNSKKRKITHSPDGNDIVDIFTDALPAPERRAETTKGYKMVSLLERIQESLANPAEELETADTKAPSSSSPLPDKGQWQAQGTTTPSRNARTTSVYKCQNQATVLDDRPSPELESNLGSEEFGSDGLDMAEWDSVGKHNGKLCQVSQWSNKSSTHTSSARSPSELSVTAVGTKARVPSSGDEDEFGDSDFSLEDFDANVVSALDAMPAEVSDVKLLNSDKPSVYAAVAAQDQVAQAIDYDSDDFGVDDIDEATLVAAEIAATQSAHAPQDNVPPQSKSRTRTVQRYLITNVIEGEYTTVGGMKQPEKVLLVEDEKTKLNKAITLRQSWVDTRCTKGSFVHIIGSFGNSGHCIVDDAQNMLILHPDHLMSALVVADSFSCMRRAVLQDRIKATSEPSPPQLYGTILHELFQQCLEANTWDTDFLNGLIEKTLSRHVEDLYDVKLDFVQATEHLKSKMPSLQTWAEVFVRAKPASHGKVQSREGKQVTMSINKLLDVEEHVWSPMYGLKGNIDATVQVVMQDDQDGERTLTVPFEVKTGKNSTVASHRAQTALYTLLLSDRYDLSIAYGILYYLESSETIRIPAIRHEIRHMIMQRNELACYVRERLSLPPMLQNVRTCNQCYAKDSCFLYHKLVEGGDGETSGLRDKFDKVVGHLNPQHQEFFKKWDLLLMKEESEMMKFRRELWTMLSTEREKVGRCFANVVLDPGYTCDDRNNTKINKYQYIFRKRDMPAAFSFMDSQITTGEPIVVSDENGHYALAKGYVVSIQKKHITVAVDRRLHNARKKLRDFDERTNQTFSGIMQVDDKEDNPSTGATSDSLLYRLDKDEFSNGLATVRSNLVQIMKDDVFRARELRKLIVEGEEPRFKQTSTTYALSGPLSQMNLNEDQRGAIEKIMAAQDYALVLGMPGTGKTTTIAHIIRALVAKGKSVLLTSYTHTAVDNILLKIREDKIGVLRLGALAKIHPDVREFATLAAEPKESIEELREAYHNPQVVATTCLGINHQVFNERTFDYCIVDEASQITLPVCLGPIRMAKTFILVGDHYQLPPLVQNREAQEGGLDVSLFKLLSDRHPSAVATLHHQYRMNREIMSISNALIYNGRLKSGSELTAISRLKLPKPEVLQLLHHAPSGLNGASSKACFSADSPTCWLSRTLSATSQPVVFINTDTVLPQSLEIAQGARITNPFEARLVTQLVHALVHTGVSTSSIGVITLYRSQLALINSELQHTGFQSLKRSSQSACEQDFPHEVEAHTTDRFQGRDKHVIILSCVRNNDRDVVGELLRDWRRVNVAVTRARSKLIIIGSKGTLSRGDELLDKLVTLCETEGWMLDLAAGAAEAGEHWWGYAQETPSTPDTHGQLSRKAVSPEHGQLRAKAIQKSRVSPQGKNVASHSRKPLGVTTGNIQKAFKVPSKVGKITEKGVFGSTNIRAKRPVLADIVNDVLGEGSFD